MARWYHTLSQFWATFKHTASSTLASNTPSPARQFKACQSHSWKGKANLTMLFGALFRKRKQRAQAPVLSAPVRLRLPPSTLVKTAVANCQSSSNPTQQPLTQCSPPMLLFSSSGQDYPPEACPEPYLHSTQPYFLLHVAHTQLFRNPAVRSWKCVQKPRTSHHFLCPLKKSHLYMCVTQKRVSDSYKPS